MALLHLDKLTISYPHQREPAVRNLSLVLEAGDRLALVGPSGCGKSTLARAILGLLPEGSSRDGVLQVAGADPQCLSARDLRQLRGATAGLVFQDPMTRLNPLLTTGDHLLDLLRAHRPGWSPNQRLQKARHLLEQVDMPSRCLDQYPHQLSGGLRQRLGIALTMALEPALVIADEPTTSLDVVVAAQVMEALSSLCKHQGAALLLITHDLALAGSWCLRMAVLAEGQLVEAGPIHQLLAAPQNPLTRALVAAARLKEGEASPSYEPQGPLLQVVGLRCWHPLPSSLPWQQGWLRAVDGIDLTLDVGETVGIVGASGCGKSTLCHALAGLLPLRGGQVLLAGQAVLQRRLGQDHRQLGRRLQIVFQDPLACFNPAMTVLEALLDPLLIHGLATRSSGRRIVMEALTAVALTPAEDFLERLPRQLSGGQQQRLAIARALILKPSVLLCDEPLAMLDAVTQIGVLELLENLQARLGLGLLLVTHDLGIAASFCHRVLVLDGGKVVEEGPGDALLADPQAQATRQLAAVCPRLPCQPNGLRSKGASRINHQSDQNYPAHQEDFA